MEESCIFCRVAAGSIPARIAYEDDVIFAFHDIDPRAPVHVLVIPREHIASVNELDAGHAEVVGKLHLVAKTLAQEFGVSESGYRLVMNCGLDAGQSVDHIHLHLIGGRPMKWPPG
jgi:histidine triad (HIT) family protein